MAFWNNNTSPDDASASPSAQQAQLNTSQAALGQSRRRLLGAALLLAMACALIPWMMDSAPRAWGDDVLLRMPKSEKPYQKDPKAISITPAPAAATANAAISSGASPAQSDSTSPQPTQASPAMLPSAQGLGSSAVLPALSTNPASPPPLAPLTPTVATAPAPLKPATSTAATAPEPASKPTSPR
jgi:hypothetical protein